MYSFQSLSQIEKKDITVSHSHHVERYRWIVVSTRIKQRNEMSINLLVENVCKILYCDYKMRSCNLWKQATVSSVRVQSSDLRIHDLFTNTFCLHYIILMWLQRQAGLCNFTHTGPISLNSHKYYRSCLRLSFLTTVYSCEQSFITAIYTHCLESHNNDLNSKSKQSVTSALEWHAPSWSYAFRLRLFGEK